MRTRFLRSAAVLTVLVGSVLFSSPSKHQFTPREKAFYADTKLVNFVRPGLVLKIIFADIASDGTIRTRFSITDPKGLPLDRDGVNTPGAVSVSFIASYIPKGATQYVAYTTRLQTSPITGDSATQASTDAGGVFEKTGEGEYQYTFRTKAPVTIDRSATHRIGAFSSRDLTEFDLGTNFANAVFNFVPDGSKIATVRDVVRTESCNKCHDQLSAHGGARRSVELCVMCHTPQTTDPDTGNTVDFKVMVHKIHAGATLPSVKAGGKYQIIGFQQSVNDFSDVVFPADVRHCQSCHDQSAGATQANNFLTNPNRAACGSCHDNVNFATGQNHATGLPQISDNQCAMCHVPQGELEFDASILGAHTIPNRSPSLPGVVAELLKVDNGAAGQKPTVTFTLKDNSGAAIPLSQMNRVALVLGGPASNYGAADFGVSTPGYVSEDATQGTCGADGICTYTFTHAIPAGATGTFSVGIEARRTAMLLAGTEKQMPATYGAINKVINFSVDGSPVEPRRTVVSIDKCNQCHSFLSTHGENRNRIEQCVMCHNPNENDGARRPASQNPPQAINFAQMIHKIHTGENLKADGGSLVIYGFGGSKNDFSDVRFPADRRNCDLCHINGSQQLPLAEGLMPIKDPRGPINPAGATTSACTGCHVSTAAASHALANTTALGEACVICHGQQAEFSVDRVHAR